MSADINNAFDKLERSLKKLSISIVDDFDEIKRGNPAPLIGLMRKLLFTTSTVVMKQLLLRGCASHVSDKKFVIAVFDLLRDTIKHSPPISIEQFFSMGFSNHKLLLVAKLAEYVAQIDRNVVYSPNKTKFVVPNEILTQINDRIRTGSEDGLASSPSLRNSELDESSSSPPSRRASSAPRRRGSKLNYTTPLSPPRGIEDVLLDSVVSQQAFDHRMAVASDLPVAKTIAMHSSLDSAGRAKSPSLVHRRPSSGSTSAGRRPDTSAFTPLHLMDPSDSIVRTSPKASPSATASPHAGAKPVAEGFSAEQLLEIDGLVEQRVKEALKEVSEKHEFIINKLVAAVDAEFTIMNNRIKSLEAALAAREETSS